MLDAHFHLNHFPLPEIAPLLCAARERGILGGVVAGVWLEDTIQNVSWVTQRPAPGLVIFSKRHVVAEFACVQNNPKTFGVFLGHGLHPTLIHKNWLMPLGQRNEEVILKNLREFQILHDLHAEFIWAIGETGFDLSQEVRQHPHCVGLSKEELIALQMVAFDASLELAVRTQKPLIVHSRGAWDVTLHAIRRAIVSGVPAVMIHCYGGPAQDLGKLADWGVFASFGGVVTWPKAHKVHAALRACDARYLLIETDAPDLPPEYKNGQRPIQNTPVELAFICQSIAEMRGIEATAIASQSCVNLLRFLGLEGRVGF